jgi:hypothetical protein
MTRYSLQSKTKLFWFSILLLRSYNCQNHSGAGRLHFTFYSLVVLKDAKKRIQIEGLITAICLTKTSYHKSELLDTCEDAAECHSNQCVYN